MRIFLSLILLVFAVNLPAQLPVTWSPTGTIAPNQYGNMHPRVVTDGSGNPLVLWGNGNAKRVYFARWTGNGFSTPVQLNPDSIPVFAASWAGPDLASKGDTVYAVFKETPEDASGIFLVRSFDGGASFLPPVRVDAIADSISRFPTVAAGADGNPLVAFMKFDPGWGDPRYVLARSTDYGASFGPDIPGSGFSGGEVCDCCPATLAASGKSVALLYRDNLSNLRNSWAGISLDGGASMAGGIEIDDTDWMINACPSSGPDGVIVGDTLHSVFMSAASGKTLCYRSRSTLSTRQLEALEPLTGNFTGLNFQNFPRIAASGKAAAIVWQQRVNTNSQLAIQFTDDIANGFPTDPMVLVASSVVNADVALANGKIFVVWESSNDGTVKYKTGAYTTTNKQVEPAEPIHDLHLSPNPVAGHALHIQLDGHEHQPVRYHIYATSGALMLEGEGLPENDRLRVDVSRLPAGSYRVIVQSGTYLGHARFVRL